MAISNELARDITDSDGKAVLETNLTSEGTRSFSVIESSTNSENLVSIEVVNVSDIEFEIDNYYLTKGSSVSITAIPKHNNNPVPNMLVKIDGVPYITDEQGRATHTYTGNGDGEVTVYANTGTFSKGVVLYDVLMYYNSHEDRSLDLNYSLSSTVSAIRKYNGIEFSTSPTSDGNITFIPSISTGYWVCEFDVKSLIYAKKTKYEDDMMIDLTRISPDILKSKPHIRLVHSPNLINIYVNDTLIRSREPIGAYPNITLAMGQILLLDNIKFMRVSGA